MSSFVNHRFFGRKFKLSYSVAYEACCFLIRFLTTVNFYDRFLVESLYTLVDSICNSAISYEGYNSLKDCFEHDKKV